MLITPSIAGVIEYRDVEVRVETTATLDGIHQKLYEAKCLLVTTVYPQDMIAVFIVMANLLART